MRILREDCAFGSRAADFSLGKFWERIRDAKQGATSAVWKRQHKREATPQRARMAAYYLFYFPFLI